MKFDKDIEREVSKILDAHVKSIAVSLDETDAVEQVRHAATKWARHQREVQKLYQRRAEINAELKRIEKEIDK